MNNQNNNNNKRKPNNQQSPNNKQNTAKLSVQQQPLQSPNKQTQQQDETLKLVKERTLYIAMSLVGYLVQVTCKNGNIYEGVLHSVNTSSTSGGGGIGVVLKMGRKKEGEKVTITTQPTPTILIEAKDFVSLTALGVSLESSAQSTTSPIMKGDQTINTDTDISGFSGVLRERELVQWTSDISYEESLDSNSGGKWDQFATNESLFGVKTTYDEGLYTTHLDKDSEFYKSNVHLAEKKASEIEGEKNINNLHILEERGHIQGSDYDEEERYSSVVRKNQPNSSTPPGPRVPLIPNTDKYIPPSERSRILQQQATTTTTSTTTKDKSNETNNKQPSTPKNNNNNGTNTQSPSSNNNVTPTKDTNVDSNKQQTPTQTNEKPSPNVSKLIFNRDNNKPVEEDHGVLGSPRDGLSPRFVEYMKVKKDLTESKTPKSPLVNNKELLTSLSLELSTQNKPDVVNDFNNFKLSKSKENVDRQSQLELYKSFSRDINMKTKSRPNSPLTSSPRISVPSPSSFSLTASSKDSNDEQIKDDRKDNESTITVSSSSTTTTTTVVAKEESSKDIKESSTTTTATITTTTAAVSATVTPSTTSSSQPTSTNSSTSSLSKFKLNPNAKTFTPSQTSTKSIGTSLDSLNKSTNGTDTQSSINDVYYDSMKKRQISLEPSDSVSQYWIDPYNRQLQYEDDPYAYRGPATIVNIPIPYYPPPPVSQGPNQPSQPGKGNPSIPAGKGTGAQGPPQTAIYSPQTPPRGAPYPPQNPYVTFAPQHFQYVPQTVVFGNPQMVPQQHHQMPPKRYYAPNQQPPPYGQPTIIPIQNQPPQPVSSPNRMISSPNYPPYMTTNHNNNRYHP